MPVVDLGFLKAQDYIRRRSPTLLENPQATLNEKQEVERFIATWNDEYRKEIVTLASDAGPLTNSARLMVVIIASQEGYHIKQTLEHYLHLDIDPSLYEILILENHPVESQRDNTYEEVLAFKNENPHIHIAHTYKVWNNNEGKYSIARTYAHDVAIWRLHTRGHKNTDTILVMNDADTEGIEKNYLTEILKEFDTHPITDALVTPTVVPFSSIIKPNLYAALTLWDLLEEIVAEGEPYNLISRSSACRISTYVAVGGYNPKVKMAGDLELGMMIADAREWNPHSVIRLVTTKHIQDPRRILVSVAAREPINEMYYDYASKPIELRKADNDKLLSLIPDYLDWELFQEDADSFWQGQDVGVFKWRGKRFPEDYKKAMKRLGVVYEIVQNRVVLKNVDAMLATYKKEFGKDVEVRHSIQRPWENQKERGLAMKDLFSTVSDGMIEARNNKANEIKERILQAKSEGGADVSKLFIEYQRFSGTPFIS